MIKVLSTLAVQGAMRELTQRFQADTGIAVDAEFAPTVGLVPRLRAGEAADITILTAQGIQDMIAEGLVRQGSGRDVCVSFVGMAVKAGAPHPDIATVEAFKATLLRARAIAYSKIGASGLYFANLLPRLGLEGQVNTLMVPTGFTAAKLVSGEADLAVQQISELKMVDGIEIVGKFPDPVGESAMFSAGLLTASPHPEQAEALLRFLTSPAAAPILRTSGVEPA